MNCSFKYAWVLHSFCFRVCLLGPSVCQPAALLPHPAVCLERQNPSCSSYIKIWFMFHALHHIPTDIRSDPRGSSVRIASICSCPKIEERCHWLCDSGCSVTFCCFSSFAALWKQGNSIQFGCSQALHISCPFSSNHWKSIWKSIHLSL